MTAERSFGPDPCPSSVAAGASPSASQLPAPQAPPPAPSSPSLSAEASGLVSAASQHRSVAAGPEAAFEAAAGSAATPGAVAGSASAPGGGAESAAAPGAGAEVTATPGAEAGLPVAACGSAGAGPRARRWQRYWSSLRPLGPVVLVGVAGLLVGWLVPQVRLAGTPRLTVDPADLDFGDKWEGERFSWKLSIRNDSKTELHISDFTASCACVSFQPRSFTLKPQQVQKVVITIDLGAGRASETAQAANSSWPVKVQITPLLATGSWHAGWQLRGRVHRLLHIERPVFLGEWVSGDHPLPAAKIPLHLYAPLKAIRVDGNLPGFRAWVEMPAAGSQQAWLHLQATAPLPYGPIVGSLILQSLGKETERPLPAQQVLVRGTVVPDIELLPSILQVGGRGLGEEFGDAVYIRSRTGRAITQVYYQIEGKGLSVLPMSNCTCYQIRQRVCQHGRQTNSIHFTVLSGGRKETITLPVLYTGFSKEETMK